MTEPDPELQAVMSACPYCGNPQEVADLTDEHVVPARIGGNLIIRVCVECNEGAALHVDNPFMANPDIDTRRAGFDVRSPKKRKKPAKTQLVGELSGKGGKALWNPGPDGGQITQVTASEPVEEPDGSLTIATPVEGSEKHLARALEKLREENPNSAVELVGSETGESRVTFEHGWGVDITTWPRFAAKVTLAMGHLSIPAFDSSREAKMLRWLFRRSRLHTDLLKNDLQALPREIPDGDLHRDILKPQEHLLALVGNEGGLVSSMILFGELQYVLYLDTTLRPPDRTAAWLLDGAGKAGPHASLDQVVGELALRRETEGGKARLHEGLPRPRFIGVTSKIRASGNAGDESRAAPESSS